MSRSTTEGTGRDASGTGRDADGHGHDTDAPGHDADGRGTARTLPATAAWAVALAAVVGLVALSTVEPAVGLTGLSGVVVGLAARWFAGSHARVALGATALPLGFAGFVAGVGVASELGGVTAVLALAAALVGGGLVAAFAGGLPEVAVRRAGDAGVVVGVVVGLAAVLLPVVSAAGGLGTAVPSVFDAFWSLERSGVADPVLGVGLAVGAVALAVRTVPAAAFTVPSRRERAGTLRGGLVRLIASAGVVVVLALLVSAALGVFVPSVGWIAAAASTSGLLRGTLATVAVCGAAGAAVAGFVRLTWLDGSRSADDTANAAVPTLAGAIAGTTLLVTVGSRVDPSASDTDLLTLILLATALCAVAVGLGVRWYAGAGSAADGRAAGTAVGLGLGLGAVVVAGTADPGGGVRAVFRDGPLAAFVALGAGLFAYRVGVYGSGLAADVGVDAAGRDVQLVRFTWTATVAGVGVLLAGVGLALATVFSPTLSVPATLGVLGGIVATGAAVWLLST